MVLALPARSSRPCGLTNINWQVRDAALQQRYRIRH